MTETIVLPGYRITIPEEICAISGFEPSDELELIEVGSRTFRLEKTEKPED